RGNGRSGRDVGVKPDGFGSGDVVLLRGDSFGLREWPQRDVARGGEPLLVQACLGGAAEVQQGPYQGIQPFERQRVACVRRQQLLGLLPIRPRRSVVSCRLCALSGQDPAVGQDQAQGFVRSVPPGRFQQDQRFGGMRLRPTAVTLRQRELGLQVARHDQPAQYTLVLGLGGARPGRDGGGLVRELDGRRAVGGGNQLGVPPATDRRWRLPQVVGRILLGQG